MNLQEIEIRPFSTSSLHETFLMEVSGRFFEIGKDVAELLARFTDRGGVNERHVLFNVFHHKLEVQGFIACVHALKREVLVDGRSFAVDHFL